MLFNMKLQVVYLLLNHRDSKQRNLHNHFIRLYLVSSIGFASKCIITIVRKMIDMPFNFLLLINLLYNPKLKFFRLSHNFVTLR